MTASEIEWLTTRLPPIEKIQIRNEADFYGASWLVGSKIGKKIPPRSYATWQHGWIPSKTLKHVRQVVEVGEADEVHLVATEEHAQFLKRAGFKKSVAVGVPYIYVGDTNDVPRMRGSLLVMPAHSLSYSDNNWDEETYAEEIAKLRPDFSCIVACVSGSCVDKGYWISAFERKKIPWIVGAYIDDKNALLRMSRIFNSFEYMTTNNLGSHVMYGAYSGCKVSIYGPYATWELKDFQNEPTGFYIRHPELLKDLESLKDIEGGQESLIKKEFPELFVKPSEASEGRAWGEEMLGFSYRRSPAEMARLLGWSPWRQTVGKTKDYLEDCPYRSGRLLYYYYRRMTQGRFWQSTVD